MGVRRLFRVLIPSAVLACLILGPFAVFAPRLSAGADPDRAKTSGKRLFEQETFGGNGRTCRTCHSIATGTVSPDDAATRFAANPNDPLFRADGSDDGAGSGATRMVLNAQTRALGFYAGAGYEPEGELFMEANIEHVHMTKPLDGHA